MFWKLKTKIEWYDVWTVGVVENEVEVAFVEFSTDVVTLVVKFDLELFADWSESTRGIRGIDPKVLINNTMILMKTSNIFKTSVYKKMTIML